jgi:hypothetical protein
MPHSNIFSAVLSAERKLFQESLNFSEEFHAIGKVRYFVNFFLAIEALAILPTSATAVVVQPHLRLMAPHRGALITTEDSHSLLDGAASGTTFVSHLNFLWFVVPRRNSHSMQKFQWQMTAKLVELFKRRAWQS